MRLSLQEVPYFSSIRIINTFCELFYLGTFLFNCVFSCFCFFYIFYPKTMFGTNNKFIAFQFQCTLLKAQCTRAHNAKLFHIHYNFKISICNYLHLATAFPFKQTTYTHITGIHKHYTVFLTIALNSTYAFKIHL